MKFEQGLQEAKRKEQEILKHLDKLPGGKRKVKKTKKMISVLRNFAGYREYNKYSLVSYFWIIKQALLKEADNLVQKGIVHEKEDIYYLTFLELWDVVKTNRLDYSLITKKKRGT